MEHLWENGIFPAMFVVGKTYFKTTFGKSDEATTRRLHIRTDPVMHIPPCSSMPVNLASHDGYLWVATLGGLMRFDGIDFDEFSFTHLPKVPNPNMRTIYLDQQKRLWLSLDRGAIVRVSEAGIRVFGREEGVLDGPVTSVGEDCVGGVWFAADAGLIRIRGDQVERVAADDKPPAAGNSSLA